jgi:hypothetical protein
MRFHIRVLDREEKCRVGYSCWCSAIDGEGLGPFEPDAIGKSAYNRVYDAIHDAMESAADDDEICVDAAVAEWITSSAGEQRRRCQVFTCLFD